ncbi:hypothetical protein [Rufibacter roseolus]|uniref:hypothetical protein n=1 Tax=Rufibacter roseolus TaxID=2817375 RepID=UPI001B302A92|nr:hypothetical protein [Rufibacter roseolus]
MNLQHWLHLPVFLFLVYLLRRQARHTEGLQTFFWAGLALKLVAGLLLGYLYLEYYGGGDTWGFHKQAKAVKEAAEFNGNQYLRLLLFNEKGDLPIGFTKWPQYSNSFFFVKLLSLLYFLTGSSYWASSLYLSLLSFWGCWFLVQQLQKHYPAYGTSAAVVFLFFPSVVFWTSGVTKDSLFIGSLCFTVGLFLQLYKTNNASVAVKRSILHLPSIYLLWRIKFFLAAVLMVLLGALLVTKWVAKRYPQLHSRPRQWMLWAGILSIGAFIASFAHPTFNLSFFVRHILWNYKNIVAASGHDSLLLSFPHLQPTLWSVVVHAPSAVFQMLTRPFLWEPAPLFYKLAAAENLLLCLLTLLTIVHVVRHRKLPKLPSFLAVLLGFFFISAVLVTLPTPNLGSLHRYRAPLLPFFFLVVVAWGPLAVLLDKVLRRRG